MLPEGHPLINKVTESLASKPEKRSEAYVMLNEKFDPEHVEVEKTLFILEANQRRKFPRIRMVLSWILAIFALLFSLHAKKADLDFSHFMYHFNFFEPLPKSQLPKNSTTEQRLLFGDQKLDALEQKRQLHLYSPKNPAYYAVYVSAHLSEKESLPQDFDETVASIAPNNAFFLYLKAASLAEKTYKKNYTSSRSKPKIVNGVRLASPPHEAEFTITDQVAFEHSLKTIAQATSLSGYETYFNAIMTARQLPLSIRNLREYLVSMSYFYGSGDPGVIRIRKIADLMNARAEQLSKNGSKDEFVALSKQRDALISHLGQNPDIYLVGELVHSVIVSTTAKNFEAASARLGLNEMAVFYGKQCQALVEERDRRDIKNKTETDQILLQKSSILHQLSLRSIRRQFITPPAIEAVDFEPLRRAEYGFLNRVSVVFIAHMLIPAALLIFFLRFLFRAAIRYPAQKMAHVLNLLDWSLVIVLGVLMPIVCFVTVTSLTSLSGREYNFEYFYFLFPSIQIFVLSLTVLFAPIVVVRWRLAKRVAPFGSDDRFTVPLSIFVIVLMQVWSCTALPLVEFFGRENHLMLGVLAVPPLLCLGLVVTYFFRAIFGNAITRLTECTTFIAVLPAYSLAIVLLCILTQHYYAEEMRWIPKEKLLRVNPNAADFGAYEFKVAAQKRAELNAITGVD